MLIYLIMRLESLAYVSVQDYIYRDILTCVKASYSLLKLQVTDTPKKGMIIPYDRNVRITCQVQQNPPNAEHFISHPDPIFIRTLACAQG